MKSPRSSAPGLKSTGLGQDVIKSGGMAARAEVGGAAKVVGRAVARGEAFIEDPLAGLLVFYIDGVAGQAGHAAAV